MCLCHLCSSVFRALRTGPGEIWPDLALVPFASSQQLAQRIYLLHILHTMLRQSFASLTRAALPPSARASLPRAATLASTQAGRRHYSEAASSPGSEGAEAASSAQPEQKVESVSEKGKGKEQKEAATADLAELTKKLEKAEDDARSFKVSLLSSDSLLLHIGQMY